MELLERLAALVTLGFTNEWLALACFVLAFVLRLEKLDQAALKLVPRSVTRAAKFVSLLATAGSLVAALIHLAHGDLRMSWVAVLAGSFLAGDQIARGLPAVMRGSIGEAS